MTPVTRRFALTAAAVIGLTAPASVQVFASYQCDDGAQFASAFYEGSVAVQLDGKALLLPQRLSLPGHVRYAKSGATIIIKGSNVTLRSGSIRGECSSSTVLPSIRPPKPDDDER